MKAIIVSRYIAEIEFLWREVQSLKDAPQFTFVGIEEVRGNIVFGNVPMYLASEAAAVVAIEYTGFPPRGDGFGIEEMDKSGAKLTAYVVSKPGQCTDAHCPGAFDNIAWQWLRENGLE